MLKVILGHQAGSDSLHSSVIGANSNLKKLIVAIFKNYFLIDTQIKLAK